MAISIDGRKVVRTSVTVLNNLKILHKTSWDNIETLERNDHEKNVL